MNLIIKIINILIEKIFGRVTIGHVSPKIKQFNERELKYFNQRKLKKLKYVSCFATSIAMALHPKFKYVTANEIVNDLIENDKQHKAKLKELAPRMWRKYKPRNVFVFWQWYLREKYNTASKMVYSEKEIRDSIVNKKLVVASTNLTRYGHIILLYDITGSGWVCNDPYGQFPYTKNLWFSGEGVIYKFKKYLGRKLLKGYGLVI